MPYKRVVAAKLKHVLDLGGRVVLKLVAVGVEIKHVRLDVTGAWQNISMWRMSHHSDVTYWG